MSDGLANRTRTGAKLLGLAAAVLLAAGCPSHGGRGPDNPLTGVTPDGKPRWVRKGSGKYKGQHGVAFYGVGIVQGISSISLARQTADNRARGAIAQMFDTYIARLMKDYQRSTSAGGSASASEQDVLSAQKSVTEVTLRGVELRDHWVDPSNGALYALAILDLNGVMRGVTGAKLPANIRDHVRRNARKAFNDLDKELRKRSDRGAPAQPAQPTPAQPTPPPAAPTTPPPPPKAPPGALKVGLKITGIDRATVQTCFANRLINRGYQVFENSSDVAVMVQGTLKYQNAGVNNGAHMVKATANIRVTQVSNNQTLVAVSEVVKVGRPQLPQSIQLAVSRLCDRVVPRVVRTISTRVK